jgi:hypothetical protein
VIFGPFDLDEIIRCVEDHGSHPSDVMCFTAERQEFLIDQLYRLKVEQDDFHAYIPYRGQPPVPPQRRRKRASKQGFPWH